MTQLLETGRFKVAGRGKNHTLDNVLVTIVELNDKVAEATGLDLVSIATGVIDGAATIAIMRQLGLTGRAYIKLINGKMYLILKGRPAHRPTLQGTRYLSHNPKVAHILVRPRDLARSAGRITGIAVVAYCTLNVVEFLFSKEDRTLVSLIGNVVMDIFKFVAAAGVGFLAGVTVGTITTIVAAPIIMAIFISVGASIILDRIDKKYHLTESLIKALERAADKAISPLDRVAYEIHRWERWIIERASIDMRN